MVKGATHKEISLGDYCGRHLQLVCMYDSCNIKIKKFKKDKCISIIRGAFYKTVLKSVSPSDMRADVSTESEGIVLLVN